MKAEEMTPFKRLLAMLKPDNSEIRNVYIFAAFSGIVGLGLPIGIQAIVNFIQMGRVSTSWIILVILVIWGNHVISVILVICMGIFLLVTPQIPQTFSFYKSTNCAKMTKSSPFSRLREKFFFFRWIGI